MKTYIGKTAGKIALAAAVTVLLPGIALAEAPLKNDPSRPVASQGVDGVSFTTGTTMSSNAGLPSIVTPYAETDGHIYKAAPLRVRHGK